LTGSVSQINSDKLENLPVGQFAQKLQGQVAGLQINQSTGQPGKGMGFRIRGAASFNGSSTPLFVIDGMPVTVDLSTINPDEVESFSVLKDAAATSLYGSRASNGVILITTKKAKGGQTIVNANASYGIQSLKGLKTPDIMNAREFAQYKKEYYEDAIRFEGSTTEVPEQYRNPEQYGEGTNWYEELTRDAPMQNYSISVMANKDKFNTSVVMGYHRQDGVIYNSNFQRYSFRTNNDYQINDRLKLGLNIAPSIQIRNNQNSDGGWQIISSSFLADPTVSPYDENGDLRLSLNSPGMFPQPNWVRVLKEKTSKTQEITLLGTTFAELGIWKGLKYKFQAGLDLTSSNFRGFAPSTIGGGMFTAPPQKAVGEYNTTFRYNWTIENTLFYNETFGEDHTVGALVGYTAQKFTDEYNRLNATDFPDDEIRWMRPGATKNGDNFVEQWSIVSIIGRLNYSFRNRYLLQATFRRDGCSRFGPGNKYANFPSVSAGWIVSDENFMEGLSSTINYLKIRTSYGLTGSNELNGNYRHIAGIGTSNYVLGGSLVPGKYVSGLGNNLLTWEENKQLDLGIDLGFFNDRIYLMYDYYQKKTDGMLYQIDIPYASGYGSYSANMGNYKSWGHEVTVQSRNLVGDFTWTTNLNLTFNRNKVTKLGTNNTPNGGYSNQEDFNRLQVGEPIGIFMGYVYDGVYMTEDELNSQPKYASSEIGTARMKDMDGNSVVDANDRVKIGDPNPDMLYGFTNEFSWKDFDLSILLQGQIGGDVINANYEHTLNIDGCFNVLKKVMDRWRSPENPGNGEVPRTKNGTTDLFRFNNSSWVYDASYLAIKNITLGYTLPIKPNRYLSRLRVYLTAQQLAVFTKYPGMNPEIAQNESMAWRGLGVDRTTYPVPRTFSIGCNITF
jgi:TonB-linked SusC/RagA family outer membrane protein